MDSEPETACLQVHDRFTDKKNLLTHKNNLGRKVGGRATFSIYDEAKKEKKDAAP